MDGQLDHFLSSEWVSDVNSTARSSWIGNISEQVNDFPVDPSASYQGDEKNVHKGLVSSNHMMGISCSEGMIKVLNDYRSAQLVSDNPILTEDNVLISRHEFQNKQIFHNSLPSQGGMEDQIPSGPLHFQLDIANRITGCQNLGLSLSNGVQMSGYKKLGDSLCMHSPSWSTPYSDISTFTSILGQTKLNGLPLQGDFTETDGALLGKIYPGDNITLVSDKGDFQILSLEAVSQVPLPQNDAIQLQQKLTQCGETNSSNIYGSASQLHPSAVTNSDCNGSAKSRPRARRGQATDPHSIAERTRREKIAERMKNLQELVPNSNKTDKASMLDEIIEYVKFLQLQVKVLSMSRVGATEAVIPLITDAQSQGSSILQPSASMARRVASLPESQESIAFEQEVIKLMESNVTSAMQYLQTNGLGLMPIALTSAIPGGNTTSQKPKTERSNGGFSSATNFPSVPRSLQVSSCRNEHPALKWEREEGATNSSSCAANVDGDK